MAITTLENVKTYLGISNTSQDSKIELLIPMIEQEILNYRNKSFETDELEEIVYPAGAELVAIKMIALELNYSTSAGKKSEKLDDYSITFTENKQEEKQKLLAVGIERSFRW